MAYVHILKQNGSNIGAFSSDQKAQVARNKELALLQEDGYNVTSFINIGGDFGFRATKGDDRVEYTIQKMEINREWV